ncbi:mechanosensitive ion channel family protein [Acetivibrio cellulolyticus]|uniref:mechanosensitive ion channel family protein n=1 Tax=Acetivibrio cellulolyticus TaxID=35830 RepID=UPI0001E2C2E4|nr:mechanosensitive ion channel family protein [Acetivibrio cellulolyticus]
MNNFLDQIKRVPDNLKSILGGLYGPALIVIKIVVVAILAGVLTRIGSFVIRKLFQKQKSFKYIDRKRVDTLSTLFVSIFKYSVYILTGVAILTILSTAFNLQPILAAAGIGGIAIGFASQSLIKDVISGAFLVFENQYSVGDNITLDNMTGVVEELQLRVTRLRSGNGDLYIIPNGEIKKVINHSRGDKAVNVDIPLSYNTDIKKAIEISEKICKQVSSEMGNIREEAKVLGITELGKAGLNLRITAKAIAEENLEVERRIRLLVKEEFSKEKIDFTDKYTLVVDKSRREQQK